MEIPKYKPNFDDLLEQHEPCICYAYKTGNYKPIVISDVISFEFKKIIDEPFLVLRRKTISSCEETYIKLSLLDYYSIVYERGD